MMVDFSILTCSTNGTELRPDNGVNRKQKQLEQFLPFRPRQGGAAAPPN
jgi:hypothetical protein